MKRPKVKRPGERVPALTGKIYPLTEAAVLRDIRGLLRFAGWYVKRIHQSLGSDPGIPDLWAIKRGFPPVWIEVKSQRGGMLSAEQADFRDVVRSQGGAWIMAQSWDDVAAWIKEHGGADG